MNTHRDPRFLGTTHFRADLYAKGFAGLLDPLYDLLRGIMPIYQSADSRQTRGFVYTRY